MRSLLNNVQTETELTAEPSFIGKILLYLHRDFTVRDIYEVKAYSDESVT